MKKRKKERANIKKEDVKATWNTVERAINFEEGHNITLMGM